MEMRLVELKARGQQLDQTSSKIVTLEEQLRSQKARTDKATRELNGTRDALSKAESELKEQLALNQTKLADNNAAYHDLCAPDLLLIFAQQSEHRPSIVVRQLSLLLSMLLASTNAGARRTVRCPSSPKRSCAQLNRKMPS